VPPVTQNPSVQPQPHITYSPSATPGTPKKEPAATPPKPEVPYYVPPVTQSPPVQPQAKVSIVPGTPKEVPPPPQPKPEKIYYTPSTQSPPATPAQSAQNQPAQSQPEDAELAATIQAKTPAQQPPSPQPVQAASAAQGASVSATPWGMLTFSDGQEVVLKGETATVGRADHDLGSSIQPEVDLSQMQGADTVSRIHAVIEHLDGDIYTLTDLNSTNATRINGKRLEPDKATPINDGDSLQFGKVTCTFKKS